MEERMKIKRFVWLIPMVLLAILPACSPATPTVDTYAIYTAAANTVQAELTNAALLTQLMDKAEFVQQSVADNTNFTAGTTFRVVWTLKNIGPTEWSDQYSIRFLSGDQMNAVSSVQLTKVIKYAESGEFAVDFIAPATLGAKTSNWCLYNASNQCFYPFYIQIIVVTGSTAATATVTITTAP
jgi:hypothetical protein